MNAQTAARLVGRNERRVRAWIRAGQLPARKDGGEWAIALEDLRRLPGVTLGAEGLGSASADVPRTAPAAPQVMLSPSLVPPDALSAILARLESIERLLTSLASQQPVLAPPPTTSTPSPAPIVVADPAVEGRLRDPVVRPRRRPDGTPKVVWRAGLYEPTRVLAANADPAWLSQAKVAKLHGMRETWISHLHQKGPRHACGSSRG